MKMRSWLMNWISYPWIDTWAADSVYVCASKSFDKSIYHAPDQQQDNTAGRFSSGYDFHFRSNATIFLPPLFQTLKLQEGIHLACL